MSKRKPAKLLPVTDEWLSRAIQKRAIAVIALGDAPEMLSALMELRDRRARRVPSEERRP